MFTVPGAAKPADVYRDAAGEHREQSGARAAGARAAGAGAHAARQQDPSC